MKPLKQILVSACAASMLLVVSPLNAQIFDIESEMSTSVTAYITKRFNAYGPTKNLSYTMYVPLSQTEGLNTQTISRLRKTFTPYPTEINEFTDEYGNTGFELIWNKDIRVVQLDLQFSARLYSNFYTIESDAPYPMVLDEKQKKFLTSTELSPANNYIINYIGRSIAYDLTSEIDVVKNIFLWLDSTIHMTSRPPKGSLADEAASSEKKDPEAETSGKTDETNSQYDALTVLRYRAGTEEGVCNLAASLFKGLGIPARVVYGISFQKEMRFKLDDKNLFFDFPNGEHFWVEIFFPDLGWVSYDPQGLYFGTTSHVIRLTAGPDSGYARDRWSSDSENIQFFQEYIYDIKQDTVTISSVGKNPAGVQKLVLSSAVQNFHKYRKEPSLSLEGLNSEAEQPGLQPDESGVVQQNSDMTKRLDIVATRNRVFAQKFDLKYPIRLTEVRLPLIKFGDDGRIWVEVYTDNDGAPGTLLFRTYYISSPRIRFMMVDDPWIPFPIGKKTNSQLEKGSYWIALRSSGSCIFNWFANGGNVIGDNQDTRFKDVNLKNPKWNNIVNVDMGYEIAGTRLKGEKAQ